MIKVKNNEGLSDETKLTLSLFQILFYTKGLLTISLFELTG